MSAARRHRRWILTALCCWLPAAASVSAPAAPAPVVGTEAPRVRALLEQAWAAESGRGLTRNPVLAGALYRQAGEMGSGEGFYRAARLQMPGGRWVVWSGDAACLLAVASQLGHAGAAALLDSLPSRNPPLGSQCNDDPFSPLTFRFDMTAYLSGLPQDRKQVASLIRRLAPVYRVDPHLALAIASAESNFNSRAVSPKMAMGVMQLIPATAERFNVRQPFDAEQNIRGGLAYLRWLHQHFGGDIVRIVAAYNAGEGAVMQHNGVPPYRETQTYVVRVLSFAGRSACQAARPGESGRPGGSC
jgi:hypothetical protein